ncbi:hypothetical protein [Mycolicibacterium goodii]|uniref:hypothetical protein n=1 Tax=Mycolicibacterium goodii TaxID=134601 RepID=UPI001C20DFA7|nr:hypothetical protein [Mycolicibacterium goodii]
MTIPSRPRTRTAPAYRYRDHLLCPTCTQDAVLPITEGAEYDDADHVLTVVAADRGIDRTTATADDFPTPIPAVEALDQTCAECETALLDTDYWTLYHEALDSIATEADTVETLITVLTHYYRPQSGAAFHPAGADRTLWDVLRWERTDWTTAWTKANYWYAMRDSRGTTFTYTEGDIDRGSRP